MSTSRVIEPATAALRGTIVMPGDKSIAHRAVLFNALADGVGLVRGLPDGLDVAATVAAVKSLGAKVDRCADGALRIGGRAMRLAAAEGPIDCGNSGTAMRLLMGALAGQAFTSELFGDSSLSARPMERVAAPLREMGARIATDDGHAPVRIEGCELKSTSHELSVASAQVKSALLLAGMLAAGATTVNEPAASRDHTERMLRAMGVDLESSSGTATVRGPAVPRAIDIDVAGDPSSAAFFAVAATLIAGSQVEVDNVGLNPTRIGFVELLRRMGADIDIEETTMCAGEPIGRVRIRSARLSGIEIGSADVPAAIDELPVIAVAAAAAEGRTVIRGAGELRVKESDRIETVAAMLRAMGAKVVTHDDGLEIQGGRLTGAATVSTAGDHRLVMAAAIAALAGERAVKIEDAQAAAVSFPGFFEMLEGLQP